MAASSQPITWRTIRAPDFSASSDMMGVAGRAFDRALTDVDDIVAGGARRAEAGRQANTADFLGALRREYQTPEALRAAQGTGELDALRGRYASLDSSGSDARAVDSLIGTLKGEKRADLAYEGALRDEATRPIEDAVAQRLAASDFAGARALYEGGEYSNEAAGMGRISTAERLEQEARRQASDRATRQSQEAEDRAWTLELRDATRAKSEADRQVAALDANADAEGRKLFGEITQRRDDVAARVREIIKGTSIVNDGDPMNDFNDIDVLRSLTDEDIRKMKPADAKALMDLRADINAVSDLNVIQTTSQVNGYRRSLIEQGVPFEQANLKTAAFEESLLATEDLSAGDRKRKAEKLARLKTPYARSALVAAEESTTPPIENINELKGTKAYTELADQTLGWNQRGVDRLLEKAVVEGVDMPSGGKMKLTLPFLTKLLSESNRSYARNDDPETMLAELVQSPLFVEEMRQLTEWRQIKRGVDAEFVSPAMRFNETAKILNGLDIGGSLQAGNQERYEAGRDRINATVEEQKRAMRKAFADEVNAATTDQYEANGDPTQQRQLPAEVARAKKSLFDQLKGLR